MSGRTRCPARGELLPRSKSSSKASTARSADEPLPTLAEFKRRERALLESALERANGKISGPGGAAELLGVKPTTLASKLEAFGLRPVRGAGTGRRKR